MIEGTDFYTEHCWGSSSCASILSFNTWFLLLLVVFFSKACQFMRSSTSGGDVHMEKTAAFQCRHYFFVCVFF